MKRKLLHVLGAGPWQLPTVRLAKAMGYRVLVTDVYPDRPGYALADEHEVMDITDREGTLSIARRHRIDGILCDTTDVGVPTAAFVAEELGLPGMGYETALNCTHKGRMRRLTDAAGLPVPQYQLIPAGSTLVDAAIEVAYPLMVKPVDSQSGRGVSRVPDASQFDAAFRLARRFSRSGEVLIEACVDGTEVIVDGFVVAGDVRILAIATKTPYPDAVTVSSRIHYPGRFPQANFDRIRSATRATLSALGLANGVFHAEVIIRSGRVVPIDIAARGGGVMIYSHVVPYVSGVDVNREMIRLAIGDPIRIEPMAFPKAANIEFIRMPTGILSEIIGVTAAAAIPGVAAIHFNVDVGAEIGPLEHKDCRPGYLITLADTAPQAIASALKAKSLISVRMNGSQDVVAIS